MNPWHAFGTTVIMQLTAITLIAALLMHCASGRSSTRHAIGVVSLFLILGSPIAVLLLPNTTRWNEVGWPDTSRPESADSSAEDQPRLRLTEQPPAVLPQPARLADDRETIAEMVRLDLPLAQPSEGFAADRRALAATLLNVMGCLWGVGVIGFGGRLLISRRRLNSIWKSSRSAAIPDGIFSDVREAVGTQQLPPIVTSDVAPMPLVLGVSRPTVVLPTGLLTPTSADRLRDVLIHECASRPVGPHAPAVRRHPVLASSGHALVKSPHRSSEGRGLRQLRPAAWRRYGVFPNATRGGRAFY